MSLMSGLFTLPVGYAIQAYKQAYHEFPIELGSEKISREDPRYAQILETAPGHQRIKSAMQPFLDKSGIRKDLMFAEHPNLGFCSAFGTNAFQKGDAGILIAPGFYETDKNACSWVIKHEISHIKNNDLFTMYLVPGIFQLAASIFGMCALPFYPALGVAFTVGIVSQALFSQWREAKADDFAIENSTRAELLGGRRFLMAVKESSLKERNTFWNRISISASGNERFEFFHPSITSRIDKIEKALRARNIKIGTTTQTHNPLLQFVVDKRHEINKMMESNGGIFGALTQMWSF